MKSKLQIKSLLVKYELVISSLIVCLFVAGLTSKLLVPNIQRVLTIHDDKKNLAERLIMLKKKENLLSLENQQNLSENFKRLNAIVPTSKDYVLLFSTLDELQNRTGVSITRSDFQLGVVSTSSALLKKPAGQLSYQLPINLEIVGDYVQTELFLRSLSDLSGRLITVDMLQLEIQDDGSVRSSIKGNTYFNPLPKSIGKIDSALPEYTREYREIVDRVNQNLVLDEAVAANPANVKLGKNDLFQ